MQITIKARNIPDQYLKALKDKKDQGMGAYYSGPRPNQTPESWAFARLASVITWSCQGVDQTIWDKYRIK